MVMENYFKDLRAKIGHDEIIMPGVAGILFDETRAKVLLEKRGDGEIGWSLVAGGLGAHRLLSGPHAR